MTMRTIGWTMVAVLGGASMARAAETLESVEKKIAGQAAGYKTLQ